MSSPEAPEVVGTPEVDHARQHLIDVLRAELGAGLIDTYLKPGLDVWARVSPDAWCRAAEVCRDKLHMRYFCFLSAVDWLPSPFGKSEDGVSRTGDEVRALTAANLAEGLDHGYCGGDTRFQLIARLHSVTTHLGIHLKMDVSDSDLTAPSWIRAFAGANWHEREVHEMFGIVFTGHPNMANLYLPGDFVGHPLRKDFPLLAREVKPWPGLVDVEPMPGEPAGEEDGEVSGEEA
ncbi:MAG: NADH-quinone oxidoreductase subunit C [Actinobacteria bacterium]|nr:NADH-quinone oxidoreductase subunit C [Actinomycetota bacterium]